jgi:hypothetical protein
MDLLSCANKTLTLSRTLLGSEFAYKFLCSVSGKPLIRTNKKSFSAFSLSFTISGSLNDRTAPVPYSKSSNSILTIEGSLTFSSFALAFAVSFFLFLAFAPLKFDLKPFLLKLKLPEVL